MIPRKRGLGSAGEGEKGKKFRTTSDNRTHTHTDTHTLPTHSLTHPNIYTISLSNGVSHTNTLELRLHLQHLIPSPSLPTITINQLISPLC